MKKIETPAVFSRRHCRCHGRIYPDAASARRHEAYRRSKGDGPSRKQTPGPLQGGAAKKRAKKAPEECLRDDCRRWRLRAINAEKALWAYKTAVELILPGAIAKYTGSEGTKAVTKYSSA